MRGQKGQTGGGKGLKVHSIIKIKDFFLSIKWKWKFKEEKQARIQEEEDSHQKRMS